MRVAEPKRVATAQPSTAIGALAQDADYGAADDIKRAVPDRLFA